MRILVFLALVANSFDLFATSVGIHWFGNREGNPLLAHLAREHWLGFVALKGVLVPLLIWRLYRYRQQTPHLTTAGLGLVTVALTVAVGEWLGWIAAVMHLRGVSGF